MPYSRAIRAGNHVFVSGMTARPLDLEGDASDDFADHAWAMLMARLNNDRSPKLHKEVYCTLIVRESTIKCAAKVRGGNALDVRASLPAKPFGGLRSNGTERLLPGKQSGYYPEARI